MNVEIGAEAALFPEMEYLNGVAVAVYLFMTRTNPRLDTQKFLSIKKVKKSLC